MNRSYLFVPATSAGMILSSTILGADAIIYDLEDGVAFTQKDSARDLLWQSFEALDFSPVDVYVRINSVETAFFEQDMMVATHPKSNGIVLPKASLQAIEKVELWIQKHKKTKNIILLVESALGVITLTQMCQASKNIIGLLLGGEDLSVDLEVERTITSSEIDLARKTLVMHAKAFNLVAIDTPYTDIDNLEGLKQEVAYAKSLGYQAKVAINPRQIETIHQVLTVDIQQVKQAQELIDTFYQYQQKGIGVFAFKGKMIDEPVVQRARALVNKAKKQGVIK